MTTFENHFETLYHSTNRTNNAAILTINNTYENWCDELVDETEIFNAIHKSKQQQQSYNLMSAVWNMLFNRCIIESSIPNQWRYSKINVLQTTTGA